MYKFTNGIIVFDEKTKNDFLKAGFTLEKQEKNDEPIKGQININEAIEETIEEENENEKNNSTINTKSKSSKRISE